MIALVALYVVLVAPNAEKMGDRLQIAVPIVGMVCAFELKDAGQYATRFFLGLGSVHAFKNALPDRGINLRPDGGGHGFPSGHTYAATYGASYIVRQCAERVPYLGPAASLGAAFVGLSRVSSEKHNIWQVISGALFGIAFDMGFRKRRTNKRNQNTFRVNKNRQEKLSNSDASADPLSEPDEN